MNIPFNKPCHNSNTFKYICDAFERNQTAGDGAYTKLCNTWIEEQFSVAQSLLTHSCTAALEMGALLFSVKQGDEVIMPSFTFVSTANAFVLRGATPVFVDIRPDTYNLDETLIEEAITPRTKAIVPVHYAGVGCEMDTICEIAAKHDLKILEDAAQGFGSTYKGKALGSIGDLGALSFHETKNIMSGEGGALLINDTSYCEHAEIIREKGTNRSKFFRGQVDKYTWVDVGSSYLPSDILAACLYSLLENASPINARRMEIWNKYDNVLRPFEKQCGIQCPTIPEHCTHNAHMYQILLPNLELRTEFINHLKQHGITAPFHYVPLHSAPAGNKYGRTHGSLDVTDKVSETLVRLPMFYDLTDDSANQVLEVASDFLEKL
ncbi:dTDP-4-amino-4,6-dideoxygalactose transaminase [Halodesulfovibrio spirochaetisodalis]|uniref:TDP-4-oxo-6-deoxy-D-glucose aminotransferase n=1 Tax=Halodesulfovibrio spirochaetisodalis TaxID=1560234 RepID=A0A1B7XL47_9BACT|nr:dTDP-4-amino-4,6-dideoxygalactose transaminase [Halodesulfovibrio spirochaetisodalis]OBQ56232.1 TDP-4-oxo-6-deoxy-D-glucose aminotransferase [Halodesulfovibrio spirochaetisodalis]